MGAAGMNRNETPSAHTAPDALDLLLHQHLANGAEPADDGFAERVLAALPAPAPRPAGRGRAPARWARWAHWTALSVASSLAAGLLSATEGRIEGEQGVAALALLALVALWSWPGRWLRP
jgi:hypothetical protein